MSTATSTLDPTAEPLLDTPDRRACQMLRYLTDGHPGPCTDPAAATVTAHCDRHGTLALPVCRYHRGTVTDGRRVWCGCGLQAAVWLIGGRA